MAHIYTNRQTGVSLWYDKYDALFKIKVGVSNIIASVDNIRDAYRLYNEQINVVDKNKKE